MIKNQMLELKNRIKDSTSFEELVNLDVSGTLTIEDHVHEYFIDKDDIIYPYALIDYGETTFDKNATNTYPLTSIKYFVVIEDDVKNYDDKKDALINFNNASNNVIFDIMNSQTTLHLISSNIIEGPIISKYKNFKETIYCVYIIEVGF